MLVVIAAGLYLLIRSGQPPQEPVEYMTPVSYHLGNWVFMLANGDSYAGLFQAVARQFPLDTPEHRARAALALVEKIKEEDVIDAVYLLDQGSPHSGEVARRAKALHERQMALAEFEPLAEVDTQWTGGSGYMRAQDGVCILSLTTTDISLDQPPPDPTPQQLLTSLRISNAGNPGPMSAMFFFSIPAAGRYLSPSEGRRLFNKVATSVHPQDAES